MKFFTRLFFYFLFITLMSQSVAQVNWTKYEENPVMSPGPPGEWDMVLAAAPWVLIDTTGYHMWYTVINDSFECIGYASSPDGITWEKYDNPETTEPPYAESDPVLTAGLPTEWDEGAVYSPSVLLIDDTYHMWYQGWDGSQSPWHSDIGHATSTDMISWVKDTLNPVLEVGPDGSWDDIWINSPCVIYDGTEYHMWYGGYNGLISGGVRIGHATSQDGVTWTKDPNNPVLSRANAGRWDYPRVDAPRVLYDGKIFHMWYSGGEYLEWKLGYAWSYDGSNWEKYEENPVLDLGLAGSWEDYGVFHCSVIRDTENYQYMMWYSGSDEEWSAQVGLATVPSIINVPGDFETIQDAIDASNDGNIILVDEGTYYENINFKGKAITVASHFFLDGDTSHVLNTIIDGSQPSDPDEGSVVSFASGEDTNSVLVGFTIQGGTGTDELILGFNENHGGGIRILLSGAKIVDNIIRENTISSGSSGRFGAGILFSGNQQDIAVIRNNKIIMNTIKDGSAWGAGIGIATKGKLYLENNIIKDNVCNGWTSSRGGAIAIDGAYDFLGDIYISENWISHNNTIKSLFGDALGGGLFMRNINPILTNNVISNNYADESGGGIFLTTNSNHARPETPLKVINNTITKNSTDIGGGISLNNSGSHADIENCIIWDNMASSYPEIELYNGASVNVTYSDIKGGFGDTTNIDADPLFSDTLFHLDPEESPCIDAGNPSILCDDPDGTRNDMGAYGGQVDSLIKHVLGLIENPDINFIPHRYDLAQNYPNPFNPATTINFQVPKTSDVDLSIYNVLGQKIVKLVSERLKAGAYQVTWDASEVASGVYYYKLVTKSFTDTKKMILLK
jgi:predicted GH43/DUF377 family glycosyl hydrolase